MANERISELVEVLELENPDQLVVVDDSETNILFKTKRFSVATLLSTVSAFFSSTFTAIQDSITTLQSSNLLNVEVTSGNFLAEAGKTYVVTAASNITLPEPALNKAVSVKKFTSASVTILPFASELIEGDASISLLSLNESATLVSDGTDWYRVFYTGLTPSFDSVKSGNITVIGDVIFIGDPDTDGTFRIIKDSTALKTQVRVSGVYEDRDVINT